jgi:TonB-dependent starch-binding outer membrane protein SusC
MNKEQTSKKTVQKWVGKFSLRFLLTSIFILVFMGGAVAQVKVTGVVKDANGEPVPGVNIIEKGTNHGTITDTEGKYSIGVSSEDAVLVFRFIGYLSEEIKVGNQTEINVTLIEDFTALDEVVIVGYGTLRKAEVTGSYSTVKGEDIANSTLGSLDKALQGKATGLQVSSSGGAPGAPQRVLVRGTNSISAGTDPLWIIDGMPIYSTPNGGNVGNDQMGVSPLSTINPNDIASIEVLKDAAATSIYGSRGSNGVILITTKSGKGNNKIEASVTYGISHSTKTLEDFNIADRDQWIEFQDLVIQNGEIADQWEPWRTLSKLPGEEGTEAPYAMGYTRDEVFAVNTDWWDAIIRTGKSTDVNVSASSSTEKGSTFLSLNYRNEEGIVLNNDLKRYIGRFNSTYRPLKNLEVSTNITGSYLYKNHIKNNAGANNNSGQGGFAQTVMNTYDFMPIYDDSHPTGYWYPMQNAHVLAQVDRDMRIDEREQYRLIGSMGLKYSLPWVEGLSLKAQGGLDLLFSTRNYWENIPVDVNLLGSVSDYSSLRKNLNYNFLIDYAKEFENHSLTMVAGTEAQRANSDVRRMGGSELQGSYKQFGRPVTIGGASSYLNVDEVYLLAYLGRINYTYRDKYLLGLSLRSDGSSKFSPENRWVIFPAFSAGWIASRESFLKSNIPAINFLKIRGSYGRTGNQNLPSETIVDIISNNDEYGNKDRAGGAVGSTIKNVASPNVTWETTDNYDVGIDFGFFQDRFQGSMGYFYQDVNDLILRVNTIVSSGIPDIWFNIGRLTNQGFEFNVDATIINRNSFQWKTYFNLTTNKNVIKALTPELDQNGEGTVQGMFYLQTGRPVGNFYMTKWGGINPDKGYDMVYARNDSVWANEYKTVYELDSLGNPLLLPSTKTNNDENLFILNGKTSLPTYFGGFGTSFSYRGISLEGNFVYSGGNYIYNGVSEQYYYIHHDWGKVSADLEGNMWTGPDDTDALYPKQVYANKHENQSFSTDFDRWLEKGDYIRLRDVKIGYTIPGTLTNRFNVDNLRLTFTMTNLITFTNYSGWDPELANVEGSSQEQNIEQGVVNRSPQIPTLKSFVFGVNLSF